MINLYDNSIIDSVPINARKDIQNSEKAFKKSNLFTKTQCALLKSGIIETSQTS